MRIALVSSYPFTHEPGGVKDFILGLKSSLQKKGCIVTIIAPGSKEAEEEGLVDYSLGKDFKIGTDQTEFRGSFSRKKTARQILRAVRPDIIVIHEPLVPTIGHTIISAIERKKYGPVPIVIGQFHARREDLGFRFKAIEFIGKHIIRRPKLNKRTGFVLSSGYISTINSNLDGRIAVSAASKKFWQRKYPAEYKVIYNGIDTNELTADGAKISSWQEDNRKIVLFAGRHDSRKGIDDLINAFDLLVKSGVPDVKLKIAGEGEMTGVLQEMVQNLHLANFIEFAGVMPREELVKAYRTADLLVAPSTDGEGFNRTIAEARSCGTLVVCTDIDGQREAIGEDLAKFMASAQNPRDLAGQIKAVLNLSNSEKQKIIKQGINDVKNRFDWSNIANQHLLFYKSLIEKNRKQ